MQTVFLLISMVLAAALAGALVALNARANQLRESLKKQTAAQAQMEESEKKLREVQQSLSARESEAGKAGAAADGRLKEARAEVERLAAEVARAEESLKRERSAVADARSDAEKAHAKAAAIDPVAIQRDAEDRALQLVDEQVQKAQEEATRLAATVERTERELHFSQQRVQQLEEQVEKSRSESRPAVGEVTAEGVEAARSLHTVVGAAQDGIALLNADGKVVVWNQAATQLFGRSEEDMRGRLLSVVVAGRDAVQVEREMASVRAEGDTPPHLFEVVGLRRDGTEFPAQIALAAWKGGDDRMRYAVAVRDLSERRAAEEARRAREAAEEANRAKTQFLANMSHELRTPLNAIIGFSEILHDRTFGDLTPKQDRYVGNILTSGRHLLSLINDILDLSKVEAGHIELEYAAFPVSGAVRNMENLVKPLLAKKNIRLTFNVPDDLPALVADQAKFKQILYNLISNAVKFTPEGGSVTVSASTSEDRSWMTVAVKDTGIGIKREDFQRVFKEFEQVDSSYSRSQQGTGLGLSLAKRFVDLHGGRIWVESEGEGKGTTFAFRIPFAPREERLLPLAPAPDTALPAMNPAPARKAAAVATKGLILVVDDDQAASELLSHYLTEANYTVERVFNGADALKLAREKAPAAITLDVELPDRDGWGVLAELKEHSATREIPVLVVSITKDREKAMDLGAAAAFVKPVDKNVLLGALKSSLIARKRRQDRHAFASKMAGLSGGATTASAETATAAPAEPAARKSALTVGAAAAAGGDGPEG